MDGVQEVDVLIFADAGVNTVIRVNNRDEGGDRGELVLDLTNERA